MQDIQPGQSVALLQELHILTRDGKLNQDSRRKLKQVNHLMQFVAPLVTAAQTEHGAVHLVDHGAGKSYFGFMLYDKFFKDAAPGSQIWSIETRAELVAKAQDLARRLEFSDMHFLNAPSAAAVDAPEIPERIDIVTALHACDTATDDAIDFALKKKAAAIVLAPCCQAEVAAVLNSNKSRMMEQDATTEIWRHPLHTREFGSHLTNVLRCLRLEASGYQVTVTELVGWEHAMKNELIIGRYRNASNNRAASRLSRLLEKMGLEELLARFSLPHK
ncbi:MAG: SAM-dependent methyltransferase [Alphaproteobacteria bacterium]